MDGVKKYDIVLKVSYNTMSSISTSHLIGKDLFKEIVKMSNEIHYCDQIKNTINRILKDLHKIPLLIRFNPLIRPLELFDCIYYTGINLIHSVVPIDIRPRISDRIQFKVDIYKVYNSYKSIQLFIRLKIDNTMYKEIYTFHFTDKNPTPEILIKWIKTNVFDFIYLYRKKSDLNSSFFQILSKIVPCSHSYLQSVMIPLSLLN